MFLVQCCFPIPPSLLVNDPDVSDPDPPQHVTEKIPKKWMEGSPDMYIYTPTTLTWIPQKNGALGKVTQALL